MVTERYTHYTEPKDPDPEQLALYYTTRKAPPSEQSLRRRAWLAATWDSRELTPEHHQRRKALMDQLMQIARAAPGAGDDRETLRRTINWSLALLELLGAESCATNRAALTKLGKPMPRREE